MAKDVLITPGAGSIQFIEDNADIGVFSFSAGSLLLQSTRPSIELAFSTSLLLKNNVNNDPLLVEIDKGGSLRGAAGTILTLGSAASSVVFASVRPCFALGGWFGTYDKNNGGLDVGIDNLVGGTGKGLLLANPDAGSIVLQLSAATNDSFAIVGYSGTPINTTNPDILLLRLAKTGQLTLPFYSGSGVLTVNNGLVSRTAILPIAQGGTNNSAAPTANRFIIFDGTRYVASSFSNTSFARQSVNETITATWTFNNIINASISGNAATATTASVASTASEATKLTISRNIALNGDAIGNVNFDGTSDVIITAVLAATGVSPGSYTRVTVDSKGRIIAGDNPAIGDAATLGGLASGDFLRSNVATTKTNGELFFSNHTASFLRALSAANRAAAAFTVDNTSLFVSSGAHYNGTNWVQRNTDAVGRSALLRISSNVGALWYSVDNAVEGSNISVWNLANAKTLWDNQGRWSADNITGVIPASNLSGLYNINISGNAATASNAVLATTATTANRLNTARTLTLQGDLSGSTSFDGSADFSLSASIADSAVGAGKLATRHAENGLLLGDINDPSSYRVVLGSVVFAQSATQLRYGSRVMRGTTNAESIVLSHIVPINRTINDPYAGRYVFQAALRPSVGNTHQVNIVAQFYDKDGQVILSGGSQYFTGNNFTAAVLTQDTTFTVVLRPTNQAGFDYNANGTGLERESINGAFVYSNDGNNYFNITYPDNAVSMAVGVHLHPNHNNAATGFVEIYKFSLYRQLDNSQYGARSITGNKIARNTITNANLVAGDYTNITGVGSLSSLNVIGAVTAAGGFIGNASTASALQTARTISLGNNLTGSAAFDGSGNITISATIASLPAISGAALTSLNASNLASGTIPNARITGAYSGFTAIGMSGQLTNTVAIGTAPFVITSTTAVTNLNADMVDGQHASAFALASHTHTISNVTGLVAPTGNALSFLRVNSAATAYEAVTPATLLAAINAIPNNADATATGSLTITGVNGVTAPRFRLNAASSTSRFIVVQTSGVSRWIFGADASAEDAGSNQGSNFYISRHSNAGATLDVPFSISRETGVASFTVTPRVGLFDVWHAGNDGAGSNLDADLLDGQQGAFYLDPANISGIIPNNKLSGTYSINITGSAASAASATISDRWANARTITVIGGDLNGSTSFDGSSNANFNLALNNTGVSAGTYRQVTVDSKGRVTGGLNPNTLAGYGITDALNKYSVGANNVGFYRLGGDDTQTLNFTGTGTIKINLPKTWCSTTLLLKLLVMDFAGNSAAEIIIAAHSGTNAWTFSSAYMLGNLLPTKAIRLGHDGTRCVILLGATNTVWNNIRIILESISVASTTAPLDWDSGWSINTITNETGITSIVTPSLNNGFDVDLLDGQHGAFYQDWANVTNKPTTLAGYGITNAIPLTGGVTITGNLQFGSIATSSVRLTLANGSPTDPVLRFISSLDSGLVGYADGGFGFTVNSTRNLHFLSNGVAVFNADAANNTDYNANGNRTITINPGLGSGSDRAIIFGGNAAANNNYTSLADQSAINGVLGIAANPSSAGNNWVFALKYLTPSATNIINSGAPKTLLEIVPAFNNLDTDTNYLRITTKDSSGNLALEALRIGNGSTNLSLRSEFGNILLLSPMLSSSNFILSGTARLQLGTNPGLSRFEVTPLGVSRTGSGTSGSAIGSLFNSLVSLSIQNTGTLSSYKHVVINSLIADATNSGAIDAVTGLEINYGRTQGTGAINTLVGLDLIAQGNSGGGRTYAIRQSLSGFTGNVRNFFQSATAIGSDFSDPEYASYILKVSGESLFSSRITAEGGLLLGSGIKYISTNTPRYSAISEFTSPTSSATGTLAIVLPFSWNNSLIKLSLLVINLGAQGAVKLEINGQMASTSNSWANVSVFCDGALNGNRVRLAHNGTRCVVLLGSTNTNWSFARVVITDLFVSIAGQNDNWQSGWTYSFLADETGISGAVEPTINASLPSGTATSSVGASPNTLALRNASGEIIASGFRNELNADNTTFNHVLVQVDRGGGSSDNLLRTATLASFRSRIGGIGSALDADLLDGQHGAFYLDWTNITNKPSIQPQDAGLTSLANLTGTGVVVATATDTFAMRAIGSTNTTDIIDRATGDARYARLASSNNFTTESIWNLSSATAAYYIRALNNDPSSTAFLSMRLFNDLGTGVGGVSLTLNSSARAGEGGFSAFSIINDIGAIGLRVGASSKIRFNVGPYSDNADLTVEDNGNVRILNNVVWHAGNDGAGSTLDADLLDGQQGTFYLDWTNVTNKPSIQPNDAGLSSIAALTGAGIVTATATDVFVMRAIGTASASDIPDRAAADLRYAQLDAANTFSQIQTISNSVGGSGNVWGGRLLVLANFAPGIFFQDTTSMNQRFLLSVDANAFTIYSTPNIDGSTFTSQFSIVGTTGDANFTGRVSSTRFVSTIATGTAPLTVSSATVVTNLNADLLDGQHGAFYLDWTNITNKPSIQPQDAGLSSIAALTGVGVLIATATDTFALRSIGVASAADIPDRSAADTRYLQLVGGNLIGELNLVTNGRLRFKDAANTNGFGLLLRKEASSFNILVTANNDADSNGTTARPFSVDLATGNVSSNTAWAFQGNVSLSGLVDLTLARNPTLGLHAATKQYVDNNFTSLASNSAALPATSQWYRIATSAINIGVNSAIFKVEWSQATASNAGRALFVASCINGITSGTQIGQIAYTNGNSSSGITRARVVFHNTAAGNFAYLEIFLANALASNVTVEAINATGWSLVLPSTVGSIPGGYSSKELVFDPGFVTLEDITAGRQLISQVANGTAPLVVVSSTLVSNLNADLLDGQHGAFYQDWNNVTNKPSTLAGYGIIDAQPLDATLTALAGLDNTAGFLVQTGADVFVRRSLAVNGLVLSNANGVAGNPTISLDAGLASLEALTGAGVVVATTTDVFALRGIGVANATDILDRTAADGRYAQLGVNNSFVTTQTIANNGGGAGDVWGGRLLVLSNFAPGIFFQDNTSGAQRFLVTADANSLTVYSTPNTDGTSLSPQLDIFSNGLTAYNAITAPRFISNVATGTAPFNVASTTVVTNLNADLLDGQQGSFYQDWANITNKPSIQPLDAGLTSLAALSGAGVVTATSTDTFVMRGIGVGNATDILDRSSGDSRYPQLAAANTLTQPLTINRSGGGAGLLFSNTTSNWIEWNTSGSAVPAFTTRSAGTKIVLAATIGASDLDYAIGIEPNIMWFTTRQATSTFGFKWYGGTTEIMRVIGDGRLSLPFGLIQAGSGSSANTNTRPYDYRFNIGVINGSMGQLVQGTTNISSPLAAGVTITGGQYRLTAELSSENRNGQTANFIALRSDVLSGTASNVSTAYGFWSRATNTTAGQTWTQSYAGYFINENASGSVINTFGLGVVAEVCSDSLQTTGLTIGVYNDAGIINNGSINGFVSQVTMNNGMSGAANGGRAQVTVTLTDSTIITGDMHALQGRIFITSATSANFTANSNIFGVRSLISATSAINTTTNLFLLHGSYSNITNTTRWGVHVTGETANYFSNRIMVGSPNYTGSASIFTTGIIEATNGSGGAGDIWGGRLLFLQSFSPGIFFNDATSGSQRFFVSVDANNFTIYSTPNADGTNLTNQFSLVGTNGDANFAGRIAATRFVSSVAIGTAPLTVTSTTVVANLNADLLDGQHGSFYQDWANITNKPTTLAGYGITNAQPLDATLTALAALDGTTGFLLQTSADTFVRRSFEASTGLSWTENVTTGIMTISLSSSLISLSGLNAIGVVAANLAGSYEIRSVGTASATDIIDRAAGDSRYPQLAAFNNFMASSKYAANKTLSFESSSGSAPLGRTVYNVATFRSDQASVTGAIVFIAPNNAELIMHALEIFGFNHSNSTVISCIVKGYRGASNTWTNLGKINQGSQNIDVRFGVNADGRSCIILGDTATVWTFPHIALAKANFSHWGVTDSYCENWTVTITTDLSAYLAITSVLADGVMTNMLDAGLTSLANLTGTGVVVATATDTFAMRAIGSANTTDILDRASADLRYAQLGTDNTFSGRLTINPATAASPFIIGANGQGQLVTGLRAATADTWTTGRTIALTGNVTGTSAAWTGSGNISFATTIANGAVTYARMQNVSATQRVLGRITAGAGVVEELTATSLWTILGAVPSANLDAGLNSIAALTGAGVVVATATDTYVIRAIGSANSTDIIDRAAGDLRYAQINAANTFTANITIAAADAALNINKSLASQTASLRGLAAGNLRWGIMLGNSAPESSGNAGSNFTLDRYSDAGSLIETALSISRSSGVATFAKAVEATNYVTTSDGRIKINKQQINDSLAIIDKLSAYSYYRTDINIQQVGLIAQEVESSGLVEAVINTGLKLPGTNSNILGIDYSAMTAIAIQGVKELHKVIKDLQEKINQLENALKNK